MRLCPSGGFRLHSASFGVLVWKASVRHRMMDIQDATDAGLDPRLSSLYLVKRDSHIDRASF